MATKDKEIKAPKQDTYFKSIMPAPAGMNAHYKGVNVNEQPISAARQVVAIALDSDGKIHLLTTDDIGKAVDGKVLEGNDEFSFSHVTI